VNISWFTDSDANVKSQMIMLGVVFLAFFGSLLAMSISSFITRLAERRAAVKPARPFPELPTLPVYVEPVHNYTPFRPRGRNKLVDGIVSFFNWYFRILGI
jgi:hypothetical protein